MRILYKYCNNISPEQHFRECKIQSNLKFKISSTVHYEYYCIVPPFITIILDLGSEPEDLKLLQ